MTHPTFLLKVGLAFSLCGLAVGCGGSPETTSGGGGTGGTTSTGGTGGANACDPGPQELAPAQAVDVQVTNNAATDRYVLLECHECEPFRVESKGDFDYVILPVVLTSSQTCGCECDDPAAYPLAYRRIKAGTSSTVTWDARTLATCELEEDCGGGTTAKVTNGALQPVEPGDYRLSYGFVEMLPPECMLLGTSDDVACTEPATPGIDPGGGFVAVEFTLPASGDVSTTLTLE